MVEPVIRRVSRKFAAGVIVNGPATAKDLAHLISMIAPACAIDAEGYRDEVVLSQEPIVEVKVMLGELLYDAAVPRYAGLAPMQERLRQTRLSYIHRAPGKRTWDHAFHVMENRQRGRMRASDEVNCFVDKWLIGTAHWPSDPRGGAVDVDVAAMRSFNCRYSALLYLRALAWMPGGWIRIYDHWKHQREASGWTTLRIPAADVCDALGVTGFTQASRITNQILEPARADLRKAGIEFRPHWVTVPGRERVHSHLSLSFARSSAATQEPPAKRRGRPPKARVEAEAA